MNVCTPIFEAKYGWETEQEKNLNEALMNTIPAVGTIFGSGLGSKLMGSGRARAFVIACCVGIFGSLLTFIEVWSVFLTAKFIVGSSIGLTGVIVARYIEEYVPLKWFGISQAISLTFLQAGIFLSTIMGAILPPDDAPESELKDNTSWYYIFALQPIMYVITIVLFFVFVRMDTPRFYIATDQTEKAKLAISKMYNTRNDRNKLNNIYDVEKSKTGESGGEKVSYKQALWTNEKFVRSSWTAILIMAFQCLTGYYAIIAYSEVLLRDKFGDGSRKIDTRQGVFLIQGFNLLGSIASIWLIEALGRRKIFIMGQAGIAISLVGIAIVSIIDNPPALLTFICIVAFMFQMTLGPLAPLYAAEVCTDVALGAVMITEDVVVLLQDFVTP